MNKATKERAAQVYVQQYLRPAQVYREQRTRQYGGGVPDIKHYTQGTPAPPTTAAPAAPVAPCRNTNTKPAQDGQVVLLRPY